MAFARLCRYRWSFEGMVTRLNVQYALTEVASAGIEPGRFKLIGVTGLARIQETWEYDLVAQERSEYLQSYRTVLAMQ